MAYGVVGAVCVPVDDVDAELRVLVGAQHAVCYGFRVLLLGVEGCVARGLGLCC